MHYHKKFSLKYSSRYLTNNGQDFDQRKYQPAIRIVDGNEVYYLEYHKDLIMTMFQGFRTCITFSLSISLLLLSSCADKQITRVSKIEHVYVRTENAMDQFIFFTEELKLPIVWDYENYGDFTSGGISLGNLVLELIDANHSEQPHQFGIALKPTPDLQSVILSMDAAGIQYGHIHQSAYWNLLKLQGLLPEEINLFICDYKDWNAVEKERTETANALQAANGGPLGIVTVKHVAINQRQFQRPFEKLPGIVGTSSTTNFENGPAILWNDSFKHPFGLVIQVNSLEAAKTLLDQKVIEYHLIERGLDISDDQFEIEITLVEN